MTLNGLMNRKYVKITTNLPKGCDDVIGTEVKDTDDSIVGKVIEYDKETGKATLKIKFRTWKRKMDLVKQLNNEQKDS
jgi:hypothetical protein